MLYLPARDPRGDLCAARGPLEVHRCDDGRPVEGQREARELVERAVLLSLRPPSVLAHGWTTIPLLSRLW